MKYILKIVCLVALLSCGFNASAFQADSTVAKKAMSIFNDLRLNYAPDKRTEIANIQLLSIAPLSFNIETTKPAVIGALRNALKNSAITALVQADTLPAKDLGGKVYGITNLSVSNNRAAPANAAEMVTQMLLGTPVSVLKRQNGYYLVRSPDGYISWVDRAAVTLMDKAAFTAWQQSAKVIYTARYGQALERPAKDALPVSDLVAGDVLQITAEKKGYYQVVFPDQRIAYVKKQDTQKFSKWLTARDADAGEIIGAGKALLGVPYLWGGTSIKGVDCSGFTKTCYFLNGIIIPRDASQQAVAGNAVDIYDGDSVSLAKCISNLQPGDLLFFTSKTGQGRDAKIVHTAIYMGNGQFIQSSGMVKINSIKPGAADYDEYRAKTLVKARRFLTSTGTSEIIKVNAHPFYIKPPGNEQQKTIY